MKFAIIENNAVVNVAVADAPLADNWIASEAAAIGDRYENGEFIKPPAPPAPTQFELDQMRYKKRAAVQSELIAWMAADNMSRVRSGVWTVADLTSLMADPAVTSAQAYMGTLSYELAAQAIAQATHPLLTPEIKGAWVGKLQEHFYLVP